MGLKSRKEGRSYVVLEDGKTFPARINRKKTDEFLAKAGKHVAALRSALEELHDGDYETFHFIWDHVFSGSLGESSEGRCWRLNDILYGISGLRGTLEGEDDEIAAPVFEETLAGFGFRQEFASRGDVWEKVLEDSREREVVEEIILRDPPLRRTRTTLWEETDYGRSSTSIKYRRLPMGKKLGQAAENAKKAREEGGGD